MSLAAAPDTGLAAAIARLAKASVMVVGDAMLDRYVFGNVSRISPEAPVPVLSVERDVALPGGAGNVVRNLTALGAAVAFVSVVGDDQAGSDLTGLIGGQPNVEPWLLVQGSRCTTVKTRFLSRGQQLLRTDHEVTGPIHAKLAERMLRIAGDALAATSVTVLSDYGKGVLAGDVPARIIAAAKSVGRKVVVQPRGPDYDRYAGADLVVMTLRELEGVTGMGVATDARLTAAARWLCTAHGFGAAVINRGADGLSLVTPGVELHLSPVFAELPDFSGAIDTVVSALAACLAVGIELPVAVRVAQLAMSVASGQPGMAVARREDLTALLTPQGRALRKVMAVEAASEQMERWRRQGFRTALLTVQLPLTDPERLVAAHRGCDRLIVAVETGDTPAEALLAEAAAHKNVDLMCLYAAGTQPEVLQSLRPDLVIEAAPSAATLDLIQGWGGEVVTG